MKIPGIQITQGKYEYWLCKVKLKDILGKCMVDQQAPENANGYQRDVVLSRAKKFGKFLHDGNFSPASILINIREEGKVTSKDGYVHIPDDYDWWIVDGQHRFEGLKATCEDGDSALREIEIPIVLLNTGWLTEAKQFLIINKLQKGVRTDLAERILLLLERKEGKEAVARQNLPIESWKTEALNMIDVLTDTPSSSLYKMIKRPGEHGKMPLKQVSVTDSLKPVIDVYRGYLTSEKLVAKALMNMWGALKEMNPECFENFRDYHLLKTPGVFVMNRVFANLLPHLCSAKERDLTVAMFRKLFEDNAVKRFFDVEYWRSDNNDGISKYGTGRKSYSIIFDLIWDSMSNVIDEIGSTASDSIKV